MPNGRPGDNPLTDLKVHGLHPFPPVVEPLLQEILKQCPSFPDDTRVCKRESQKEAWWKRIHELTQNQNVEETVAQ